MTQEEVMEQVRKRLSDILLEFMINECGTSESSISDILAIPEILIKDPDQSLPDITGRPSGISRLTMAADMKADNWVKVIKEK